MRNGTFLTYKNETILKTSITSYDLCPKAHECFTVNKISSFIKCFFEFIFFERCSYF